MNTHEASEPDAANSLQRYVRQMRYPPIGREGQLKLNAGSVLVCGCGALGSVISNSLVRAGVGHVRLVDRDFLELNNLQRQVLYDEADVASGLPKAIVAQRKLNQINSDVQIEGIVADVDHGNIQPLCEGVDVILDGTDNFETRFLLNDASIKFGIPWIFGGCIGDDGQTMTIVPGQTACLHCLMQDGPPPPGTTPTCDSAGILGPIIQVIASLQVNEAIKILCGQTEFINRELTVVELWENRFRQLNLDRLREQSQCPTCHQRDFSWLEGRRGSHTAVLCGRNAVQLSFPERTAVSLDQVRDRLQGIGELTANPYLLRLKVDGYTITLFADGRAIISGTEEIAEAKTIYAKYIGN